MKGRVFEDFASFYVGHMRCDIADQCEIFEVRLDPRESYVDTLLHHVAELAGDLDLLLVAAVLNRLDC